MSSSPSLLPFLAITLPILFRILLSYQSYSGHATPPKYGDYEAQRTWIATTYTQKIQKWYTHELQYWGLDYPPGSAYLSYIVACIHPNKKEMTTKGNETKNEKTYLRTSVMAVDILVYFVAVIAVILSTSRNRKHTGNPKHTWIPKIWRKIQEANPLAVFLTLLSPPMILIDHGHFQYNCVMLGFAVGAYAAFCQRRYVLGAVCFCFSLCFKQMALYYSIPIFCFLLGTALQKRSLILLIRLGLAVLTVFAAHFGPFYNMLPVVLRRIFPVARGIFEDKVANFWCVGNLVIKFKSFNPQTLLPLSGALTLAAVLPSAIAVLRSPQPRNLLSAIIASSLAFFLFSFQVHEKSILLPWAFVVLLLITSNSAEDHKVVRIFGLICIFSLYPLLRKDGLAIAYLAMQMIWYNWSPDPVTNSIIDYVELPLVAAALLIHSLDLLLVPPKHLPDIWVVANCALSFAVFALTFVWATYQSFVPATSLKVKST